MRLSQSLGWIAPWSSATSPHGDARPSWDAAGRICGPQSSKNWNAWGSAKQNGVSGNSTATSATMRRRVQLAKGWTQYEAARREAGNNGQYGLVYGLSLLIRAEPTVSATNAIDCVMFSTATNKLDMSRCEFITGDALTELRKMSSATVNVVICSPPYWPVKRWYGGKGIGFEPTLDGIHRQSGCCLPRSEARAEE